jgi:hypothetical protein
MNLTKEQKKYFVRGVVAYIDQNGLTQKDVALQAGTHPQSFSRYKVGKVLPRKAWRDKISAVLGVDEMKLVELGKDVALAQKPKPAEGEGESPTPVRHDPIEATLSHLREAEALFREMSTQIIFANAAYEALPVATILIENGIVIAQNAKSRQMGKAMNMPLCDSCIDRDCQGRRADCVLTIAITSRLEAHQERVVNGVRYRLSAVPFSASGREYIIATATDLGPQHGEA